MLPEFTIIIQWFNSLPPLQHIDFALGLSILADARSERQEVTRTQRLRQNEVEDDDGKYTY